MQVILRLPHVHYGADYNPEEVWREDVRFVREAGVNIVFLGLFSWLYQV